MAKKTLKKNIVKEKKPSGVIKKTPTLSLYRKGVVALRDMQKKDIDIAWQFSKTDKKQAGLLQAIESRLQLIGLDHFRADLVCTKLDNKIYYLSGSWSAVVTQQCVVSLDDFEQTLRADLHLDFIEQRFYDEKKHKEVEPLEADDLDTLDQVIQELSLSLDPFPKKPGATIPVAWRAEFTPPPSPDKKADAVKKMVKSAAPAFGKPLTQPLSQPLTQPLAKPFANLAEKLKTKDKAKDVS